MSNASRPAPPRADHVGSFLRPPELYAEIERVYAPQHTALPAEEREQDLTRLRELEDACIRRVVARQQEIGLEAVTDGELRRYMFTGSFYDSVDGLQVGGQGVPFLDADGNELDEDAQWRKLEEMVKAAEKVWGAVPAGA